MGPHAEIADARTDVYDAVHVSCGVSACSSCAEEIAAMTAEVNSRLSEEHLHDGGNTLAQTLWILIRHRKPARIVETGWPAESRQPFNSVRWQPTVKVNSGASICRRCAATGRWRPVMPFRNA